MAAVLASLTTMASLGLVLVFASRLDGWPASLTPRRGRSAYSTVVSSLIIVVGTASLTDAKESFSWFLIRFAGALYFTVLLGACCLVGLRWAAPQSVWETLLQTGDIWSLRKHPAVRAALIWFAIIWLSVVITAGILLDFFPSG
jgi:hypothetical protein